MNRTEQRLQFLRYINGKEKWELTPSLWRIETDFIHAIVRMEENGVLLNQDLCREQYAIGTARMIQLKEELGFNPNSSKDLQRILIDEMNFPVVKLTKGGKSGIKKPAFDKDAMAEYELMLEAQGSDMATDILEYRGWVKTTSSNYKSYLDKVSNDGRLRPNFKIHGTKNVRMSCEDPNLQQIPKQTEKIWNGNLKSAFIARDGYVLVGHDYSQLEFRLAAHYAKQPDLLAAFSDRDRDVFWEMAKALDRFTPEGRNSCKTLTYAKLFGAMQAKIQYLLGEDPASAAIFYNAWEVQYPEVVALAKKVNSIARSRGYIKLWTGRRRHFDYPSEARKGFNSLIQGGGAEIVKRAIIRVDQRVNQPSNGECRMVLQVHDQLVHEIREDRLFYYEKLIREEMERVNEDYQFKAQFPVAPEIWGDKARTKELFG